MCSDEEKYQHSRDVVRMASLLLAEASYAVEMLADAGYWNSKAYVDEILDSINDALVGLHDASDPQNGNFMSAYKALDEILEEEVAKAEEEL